jgi:hypothetical protein
MHSAGAAVRPPNVTDPALEDEETVAEPELLPAEPDVLQSDHHLPTPNRRDIPHIHIKKYDALFKKLRQSDQFHVDVTGQVVLAGAVPVAHSNFHKLMRSMFVSSFASDSTVGRREFLNALKVLGVRASEVSSQSAKVALGAQGGSGPVKRKGPPGERVRILRVYQ